ncbi:hypothetical protein LRS13_00170 [Svornostia abyssi]|uniref:Uncharacterized protein n=1 Tax=Svornostia abyssi TaxID=2898438 RepID=A0ABY5PH47_9ACTN|nr:hypothetical protein LRS13_00170 [Parviterribacteraceae bacterium J379]
MLSENIAEHLHQRHAGAFDKAIAVAGKLPSAMTAKLAQHAMGPTLSARAAGLLEPKQAADLAKRLPPLFLADVAVHADLRQVGPLVEGISPDVMAEAGAALREREEWIVLGAFVGHVREDALVELIDVFDAEALLRVAPFVDAPERFDVIVGALDEGRLEELVATADERDLRAELDAMLEHLAEDQAARLS